jgi:hypothetical protein
MLYREVIAVCSEIHTKHINRVCGQNVELLTVKLAVHIVTAWLYIYNYECYTNCSTVCDTESLTEQYSVNLTYALFFSPLSSAHLLTLRC